MTARARWRWSLTDLLPWAIGLALVGLMAAGAVRILAQGAYSGQHWLGFVVLGLAQGGVYALVALGYTMVYGILNLINFAHGEVFMSGAFAGYFVAAWLERAGWLQARPLPALLVLLATGMLASTAVALLVERVAYRPLRERPRLALLITAIGASFFLQYAVRGLFGSGVRGYPDIPLLHGSWTVAGVAVQRIHALTILAALGLMALLYAFVQRTRAGKAMRAVAEDREAAALMGIDPDRAVVTAFVVGAMAAGAAGVLYGLIYRQVYFYMGFLPGLKAFTAAVLGGIGNIPGAMVGGLFLGVFEALGPSLFLEGLGVPAAYQLKDVIAYTLLVLILIFRPTGLLGERLAKRA